MKMWGGDPRCLAFGCKSRSLVSLGRSLVSLVETPLFSPLNVSFRVALEEIIKIFCYGLFKAIFSGVKLSSSHAEIGLLLWVEGGVKVPPGFHTRL